MCSSYRINFILSCFMLFTNLYLIQYFNYSIYNFFPDNNFLLYPNGQISLLWTILNITFAVVFMVSECLSNNNNNHHLYSFIFTCIFNCLYHYLLFSNGIPISLIPLIILFICTMINIYELTKCEKNYILENMILGYSFWVFLNILFSFFILLTKISSNLFISIVFTLILIFIDWFYLYTFVNNRRAIIASISCNILNIGINFYIILNRDPYHYSFYSLIFTIYIFFKKLNIIYKKKLNDDYQNIP